MSFFTKLSVVLLHDMQRGNRKELHFQIFSIKRNPHNKKIVAFFQKICYNRKCTPSAYDGILREATE